MRRSGPPKKKPERFVVGVSRIVVEMSGMDELKQRRSVVATIKDRVLNKFSNVSIADVGPQDVYDEAILGVALVSNDRTYVESILNKIPEFIDELGVCRVLSDDHDVSIY